MGVVVAGQRRGLTVVGHEPRLERFGVIVGAHRAAGSERFARAVLDAVSQNLVVVFELGTLEVLRVVFELAVEQVALEVVLLVVLDQPHGVVDQFLPLPELAGVDDDQILAEVQLADILREGPVHGQIQGQFSLNLLLQVSGDFML